MRKSANFDSHGHFMTVAIMIGVYYAKRANKSFDEYYLGGRSLGLWVTVMSAETSDGS